MLEHHVFQHDRKCTGTFSDLPSVRECPCGKAAALVCGRCHQPVAGTGEQPLCKHGEALIRMMGQG